MTDDNGTEIRGLAATGVCDNALAVKASIPRPHFQGNLLDSDGHGGQQYAPLMAIEVPGR